MTFVKPFNIRKYEQSGYKNKPDLVAVEEPLEIRVGFGSQEERQQRSISLTMRTPGHDFELAIGFLFTEGIIEKYEQVENVHHCENVKKPEEKENVVRVELSPDVKIDFEKLQRHFYTTSSCGVCGKSSMEALAVSCKVVDADIKMNAELIHALPDKLRQAQTVFEHTGGLHASALFDVNGELIMLREDVGRHNALDKIIGAQLFSNAIPISNQLLLLSGRASFELIQKAAVAAIPIIAAVGAPSSLAAETAEAFGITLLGFVRDQSFNIYTHPGRIVGME